MTLSTSSATQVVSMGRAEFADRFGSPELAGALCGYTRANDTRAVLALVCHARPRRVLEIGTGSGHMTANLTRWTHEEARVFTMDRSVRGMGRMAPARTYQQQVEVPWARGQWMRSRGDCSCWQQKCQISHG